MKQLHFWQSVFLLFLITGCYASDVTVVNSTVELKVGATAIPIDNSPLTPSPSSTIELTPTATTSFIPTSTPIPTATSTWTPVPTMMPTADPEKIPQMVWSQYWRGSYTDPSTVLAVRGGIAAYEDFPMHISRFWDYSPVSGRVAFSNAPSHESSYTNKSVTDLWTYNYETGQTEMWISDNVGSARWSPNIDPETGTQLLAVSVSTQSGYVLQILSNPENVIATIPDVSSQFAWSSDGQSIAFFGWLDQKQGIYIVPVTGGPATYVANLHYIRSVLDGPLWIQADQAIVDSTSFNLYFIDGTSGVRLPDGRSPINMLWDSKTQQLLVGFEADWGSAEEIRVFEFSEDLQTITKDYVIGGYLADWLIPGEKLLLGDGQIIDWPIDP